MRLKVTFNSDKLSFQSRQRLMALIREVLRSSEREIRDGFTPETGSDLSEKASPFCYTVSIRSPFCYVRSSHYHFLFILYHGMLRLKQWYLNEEITLHIEDFSYYQN